MWRLTHNDFPTREVLLLKIVQDTTCFRCLAEIAMHALHDCKVSSSILCLMGLAILLATLPYHDAAIWLSDVWDILPSSQHLFFTITLRFLWNAQNAALFGSSVLPPGQIVSSVKNCDADYQKVL